jgi:predicted Zn-dependent peptidase
VVSQGKQLGTGGAARTTATKTEKLPNIAFEKYKLKNGLDVILSEDHTLPQVSVNIWYHVGQACEVQGRTGFAHLFEHMMFERSEHVGPKAHFRYLDWLLLGWGCRGGVFPEGEEIIFVGGECPDAGGIGIRTL